MMRDTGRVPRMRRAEPVLQPPRASMVDPPLYILVSVFKIHISTSPSRFQPVAPDHPLSCSICAAYSVPRPQASTTLLQAAADSPTPSPRGHAEGLTAREPSANPILLLSTLHLPFLALWRRRKDAQRGRGERRAGAGAEAGDGGCDTASGKGREALRHTTSSSGSSSMVALRCATSSSGRATLRRAARAGLSAEAEPEQEQPSAPAQGASETRGEVKVSSAGFLVWDLCVSDHLRIGLATHGGKRIILGSLVFTGKLDVLVCM